MHVEMRERMSYVVSFVAQDKLREEEVKVELTCTDDVDDEGETSGYN